MAGKAQPEPEPKSKSARKDAETQSYRKVFFFYFCLRNLGGFASLRECF